MNRLLLLLALLSSCAAVQIQPIQAIPGWQRAEFYVRWQNEALASRDQMPQFTGYQAEFCRGKADGFDRCAAAICDFPGNPWFIELAGWRRAKLIALWMAAVSADVTYAAQMGGGAVTGYYEGLAQGIYLAAFDLLNAELEILIEPLVCPVASRFSAALQ